MKKISFLIILVLLLVLWQFWPTSKTIKNQQPPNIVSKNDQFTDTLKKPSDNKIKRGVKSKPSITKAKNTAKILEPATFSYLQLYRDFRRLENCPINKNSLISGKNIKELKRQRIKAFKHSGMQVNLPVSGTHLNHYEWHLDQCIQLIEKYKDIDIAQQLLTASTVTEKEKQLQSLRRLIQPWDDVWQHLFNVSKGIISPEAVAIKKQLDELDALWRQQQQGIEFEFTDAEQNAYFETKKSLKTQLEQLTGTNPQIKAQAWHQVQKLTAEIKAFMLLQDADLFFEASALLNDDRQLRFFNGSNHGRNFKRESLEKLEIPYKKVAEEVNQLTGSIDRLNFLAIAPYANQLYLCALGQDCTPGSTLMSHYCLSAEYPTACDKDLMAFFTDDYLSPNQLQDVLNLLDQLVIIYEP